MNDKEKKEQEKSKNLVDKYYELKIISDKPEFQVLMEEMEELDKYGVFEQINEVGKINLDNSTKTI